jgi:hypothetical protein
MAHLTLCQDSCSVPDVTVANARTCGGYVQLLHFAFLLDGVNSPNRPNVDLQILVLRSKDLLAFHFAFSL